MFDTFPQTPILEQAPKENKYRLENGVTVTLDTTAKTEILPSERYESMAYNEPEITKFRVVVPTVTRYDPRSDVPLIRDGQWFEYSLVVEIDNGTPIITSSSMIDKRSFSEDNPVYYQIDHEEVDNLLETETISKALDYIKNSLA